MDYASPLVPFDADTYDHINYLEIIILEDGTVYQAVPSHQMTLLSLAARKFEKTPRQVADQCPEMYYFDYDHWLRSITGSVCVWYEFTKGRMNLTQARILHELKERGMYVGAIYSDNIKEATL